MIVLLYLCIYFDIKMIAEILCSLIAVSSGGTLVGGSSILTLHLRLRANMRKYSNRYISEADKNLKCVPCTRLFACARTQHPFILLYIGLNNCLPVNIRAPLNKERKLQLVEEQKLSNCFVYYNYI